MNHGMTKRMNASIPIRKTINPYNSYFFLRKIYRSFYEERGVKLENLSFLTFLFSVF